MHIPMNAKSTDFMVVDKMDVVAAGERPDRENGG